MRNFGLVPAAIAIMAAGSWSGSLARESGKPAQANAGASVCNSHGPANAAAVRAGGGTSSWHEADVNAGCQCCGSWMTCRGELDGAHASTQVVSMKNGVLYVYMAETPAAVRAVQAAVAQHHDRLEVQAAAGDKTPLCTACRTLRGATASGRLLHEVLNLEGGCIMVMTTSDPAVLVRIRAEARVGGPARAKL